MDTTYLNFCLLVVGLILSCILGHRVGYRRCRTSAGKELSAQQARINELERTREHLIRQVWQLEWKVEESGEWIEVPVILHGLSWSEAAHTFVELHSKTGALRAGVNRTVMGKCYAFDGKPKPVLGSPRWQYIQEEDGSRSQSKILLLGEIYTWR